MRIKIVTIILFSFTNIVAQVTEKRYVIQGVSDTLTYSIKVSSDVANEEALLSISDTDNNSYTIDGVAEIKNITIHSNVFLEIQFRIRGGSGIKLRRTVLLCVSNGKIYRCLDILSENSTNITKAYNRKADSLHLFDEHYNYLAKLSIKQTPENSYKAVLYESTKAKSKYDPTIDQSSEKQFELQFETSGYFFHNSIVKLNKNYVVYLTKNETVVNRLYRQEVFGVQLNEALYLFIDDQWYVDNGNDSLTSL